MRRPYRLIGIVLLVAGLGYVYSTLQHRAKIRHIILTTPLPITLKQMLLHEPTTLPAWEDVHGLVNVTLFEGLPHQKYESDLLKAESKRKDTIGMDGFPFYSETLEMKEDDKHQLLSMLTNRGSFETQFWAKSCGGFHPDYALQLSTQGTNYFVQICLGCGDIRVISPDASQEFSLTERAANRLHKLLDRYHKNRPKTT